MKKALAVAALIATCAAGSSANAADMPVKGAAPAAAYDPWTGCYVGANGGYGWTDTHLTRVNDGGSAVNDTQASLKPDGWAYGGQLGCDYRFNSNWVAGIRGMWDGMDASATRQTFVPNNGNFGDQFYHDRVRSFETLTARLGALVSPTFMVYATGGVAWVQNRVSLTDASAGGQIWSKNTTGFGYDVGAGVSWMIAPNWEAFAEYDHIGIGNHNFSVVEQLVVPGRTEVTRQKQDIDKVLVGLNYRFGAR